MKHTEKNVICSALTDDIFMKISKIEMTSSSYFPVRTCSNVMYLYIIQIFWEKLFITHTQIINIYIYIFLFHVYIQNEEKFKYINRMRLQNLVSKMCRKKKNKQKKKKNLTSTVLILVYHLTKFTLLTSPFDQIYVRKGGRHNDLSLRLSQFQNNIEISCITSKCHCTTKIIFNQFW